jgi:DNA primase
VPALDFRVVREMVSMAEVLRLLDYPLPLAAVVRMRGPCPVHRSSSSKSRTFSVHLKRNVFHCFRCGAAGNHLDLFAAVTGQRLYQAAILLCERLGRPIPWAATRRATQSGPVLRHESGPF